MVDLPNETSDLSLLLPTIGIEAPKAAIGFWWHYLNPPWNIGILSAQPESATQLKVLVQALLK